MPLRDQLLPNSGTSQGIVFQTASLTSDKNVLLDTGLFLQTGHNFQGGKTRKVKLCLIKVSDSAYPREQQSFCACFSGKGKKWNTQYIFSP